MPLSQEKRNSISGKHLFGKLKPIFYGNNGNKMGMVGAFQERGKHKKTKLTMLSNYYCNIKVDMRQ